LNEDSGRPQLVKAAAAVFLGGVAAGWFLNPFPVTVDNITAVPFVATAAHNLRIVAILAAGGFVLAIPTVLVAIWNGFQVGGLLVGIEPSPLRMTLVVHGVPESLGQIAATTAGLGLAIQIVRRFARDQPLSFRPILRWTYAAVVLTVIAAALESFVTPAVAQEVL